MQRSATLTLLESLDAPDWDAPCVGHWRVREVVAHLITLDQASTTGRLVPLLRSVQGRSGVERWSAQAVRRWAERSPDELLAALTRWGDRLARTARVVPTPVLKLPIGLLYGQLNLSATILQRVVDEWVHTVDIARATGRRAACPVPVPAALADGCLARLPGAVLPHVGRAVGVVRLEVGVGPVEPGELPHGVGGGPWERWGVDFSRKHYGPRVGAQADVTVRLHATALALLAERRADRHDVGLGIEVEGDGDLAADLLDAVALGADTEMEPG